jgi:hypothetical protein
MYIKFPISLQAFDDEKPILQEFKLTGGLRFPFTEKGTSYKMLDRNQA